MVFEDNAVVFPCDICKERRKEHFLGTNSVSIVVSPKVHPNGQLVIAVRYCQDKTNCVRQAALKVRDKIDEVRKEERKNGQAPS